jgi:hypothetical protein
MCFLLSIKATVSGMWLHRLRDANNTKPNTDMRIDDMANLDTSSPSIWKIKGWTECWIDGQCSWRSERQRVQTVLTFLCEFHIIRFCFNWTLVLACVGCG